MHDPRSRGFAFIETHPLAKLGVLQPMWKLGVPIIVGQLPQLHPFLHQVQICLLLLRIINICKSKSVISIVTKERVKLKTVYTNILNGT
jgi:hypothetical protein